MKRSIIFFLLLAVVLSLPACLKVAQQAQVMSQAEIDKYNGGQQDEPSTPEVDPTDPTDPDDPAPSDDRITDGSAYFVRPRALGLKDGSSWNNALDAAGLRELIAQKLNGEGTQDDAAAYAQADKLDGAKFYFCTGKYLLADPDDENKVLKLEWSRYSKQVRLEFYGGYAGSSSGIDLSQRNVSSNVSMLTGDVNENNMADENDLRILVLGNQVDLLIDGMTLAYAYNVKSGCALTISAGAGQATATLNNCIVRDNTVSEASGNGAGVTVQIGKLVATNTRFSGNYARNGAALAAQHKYAVIEATSCTFQNNIAFNCGGVLNLSLGKCTFTNCTFSNNKSNDYAGGVIHANGRDDAGKPATLICNGCTFKANEANRYGGAVSMETADVTLTNCTFDGNKSATGNKTSSSYGGTVSLISVSSLLNMSGCTFKNNESDGTSSTLYHWLGRSYLDNCRFENNKANNRGVVRLWGESADKAPSMPVNSLCYMNRCFFTGSAVSGQWGVVLQLTNFGAFCANNCTIANSTASHNDSCTINGSGNAILVNCTVADISKKGTMRTEGGRTVSLINTVLVNTDNSKHSIVYGGNATVQSLGSCILGTVNTEGSGQVFTPGDGDLRNVSFGNLSMTWDSASYVYKWSGNASGHTKMATASIDNLVKNALPITVKGLEGDTPRYQVDNVGQDFYNWVTSTLGSSFTLDAIGTSRGSAATCGAYQAN